MTRTTTYPVCEEHGIALSLHDDGDVENGPGEPYLACPACVDEQESHCPQCDGSVADGFTIISLPTRQYGGGFDTFYRCASCGYEEVCT